MGCVVPDISRDVFRVFHFVRHMEDDVPDTGHGVSHEVRVVRRVSRNVSGVSDEVSQSSDVIRQLSHDVSRLSDAISGSGNFVRKSSRIGCRPFDWCSSAVKSLARQFGSTPYGDGVFKVCFVASGKSKVLSQFVAAAGSVFSHCRVTCS